MTVPVLGSYILGWLSDKVIEHLSRRSDAQIEREKIRAQTGAEAIKAAVEESRTLADLNKAKFQFPWFWLFAGMFLFPLAIWWAAILLDSTFHFGWRIADLPTPELKQMAKDMVTWVFYVGSGVGVLKALLK